MTLNIAFIVSAFPTVSETFIVNQICDLIDKGHEVTIFSFNKNEDALVHKKIRDYNLLQKVVYHRPYHFSKIKRYFPFLKFLLFNARDIDLSELLRNFNILKGGEEGLSLKFFYKYYWILEHGPFDILHAHFGANGAYVARMKTLGFLKKTGFISTFHGYDLNPKLLPEFKTEYQELFRQADFLTVNTEYSEELLSKITNRKIEIVPVGLDTDRFSNQKKNMAGPVKIIFIGRLIALKGAHRAIEIFRILMDRGLPDIKLSIVGEGEMRKDLWQLIADHDLENNIELKGALTQEEVLEELSAAQIFLFPGIYDENGRAETQGLVIQEAQAMGIPVIVSDAGGMKYGLMDGETGFVIGEKQLKEFADKIEYLIRNENKRIEMGDKAKAFVKQHYDSKILGDKMVSLYEKALK